MEQNNSIKYADIWSRVGAFIIDILVVMILAMIIALTITFLALQVLQTNPSYFVKQHYPILIGTYVSMIVFTFYNSLMDSSRRQGTVGKIVFKLQATDIKHKRLSFWRALLKYTIMCLIPFIFGQIILVAIIVMAIPIAFTSKMQGMYDMIAGSLVIKRAVADVVITNENVAQDDSDLNQNE